MEIDRIIHEPARYRILALLSVLKEADFLFIMRQTGLTRGNLSSHMSKLESVCWDEVDSKFICQTRMQEDPFEPGDFEFIACEAVIAGFDVHHKAFHVPTEQMRDITFKLPNDPDY